MHTNHIKALAALVGAGLIVVGLIGSSPAAAAELVTAEQTGVSTYGQVHGISGGSRWAQTFRPSVAGPLHKVTLNVAGDVATNADLVIQIQETTAGLPDDTVLTSLTVPNSALPQTSQAVDFTFPTAVNLATDQTYAIVLSSTTTVSSYAVALQQPSTAYADGSAAYAALPGAWTADSTTDLYFIAYVDLRSSDGDRWPPDIVEAFGLPSNGSCTPIPEEVRTNIADRHSGWGRSWTDGAWLNGGSGGPVCVRTLRYSPSTREFHAILR